jgi:hypothetical protein
MAQITEEHLHHMARRHHATMQQLGTIHEKMAVYSKKGLSLLETGFGAWAGGMLEGRTGGKGLGPIPYNLGIGLVLAAVGAIVDSRQDVTITREVGPDFSRVTAKKSTFGEHLTNLGNGFLGSYLAATGYAFGKRWKETGKILGGGGHPWTQPYENGWPKGGAGAPPPAAPGAPAVGWYD